MLQIRSFPAWRVSVIGVSIINRYSVLEAVKHQGVFCYRSEIPVGWLSVIMGYSVTDQRFPSMEAINHQWVFCCGSEISQCGVCQSAGSSLFQIRDFPVWLLLIVRGYSVMDQRFPSVESINHQGVFCFRSEISQCGGY